VSATDNAGPQGRFIVKTTSDSHFSWLRTRLSVERTLMAWMRTAVSLIGFGFTIVQFFERMNEFTGVSAAQFSQAPRYLGLALILCGVLSLVISVWEYEWTLRYLRSGDFAPIASADPSGKRVRTPLVAVAVVLSLIGAFAFFSVLFRLV
jgi:putative membrane protein